MLFTEFQQLYSVLCDHAQLTNTSVPLRIGYTKEYSGTDLGAEEFSYEKTIDRLPYIIEIQHEDGTPLLEWLQNDMKAYKAEFYQRIDNAMNAWLERVRGMRGVTEISKYPDVKNCKEHFIWFNTTRRTCLSVGVPRLEINPFSYQQSEDGYGFQGVGLSVPRNIRGSFQKLIPSPEEFKTLRQYKIDYEICESKEVFHYEAVQFYQEGDESSDEEY